LSLILPDYPQIGWHVKLLMGKTTTSQDLPACPLMKL